MTRSIVVGEVRTGRRITQIPVVDAQWSMVHGGPGDIVAEVPLRASEFARYNRTLVGGVYPGQGIFPSPTTYPSAAKPVWTPADGLRPSLLAALEPVRCFLAVLEGDTVLEAGPIWRWDWDDRNGRLRVTAKGIETLFDHRIVMGQGRTETGPLAFARWGVTYVSSLGTIAKRLLELGMAHAGGDLPIALPADVTGDNERNYRGYDLATVRERLDQIADVDGGPEMTFRPRLSEDRLGIEWDFLTGDPLLDQSPGPDVSWSLTPSQGPVVGVSLTRDASKMTGEVFAADSGMDESRRIARRLPFNAGVTDLRDHGFPLLQSTVERQGGSDDGSISMGTLQAYARGELKAHNRPYSEVTLTVADDVHPRVGTYRPGWWATVWGSEHPLLSLLWPQAGPHRARIATVSGNLTGPVDVGLMPQMEVR